MRLSAFAFGVRVKTAFIKTPLALRVQSSFALKLSLSVDPMAQLRAMNNFRECFCCGLDVGTLSFRSHRLTTTQQSVSAEGDNDPHA